MWRYQNTNELYHGLYHQKCQNSDELYHWKYVKKEKVNGKWRYYYDDTIEKEYKNALKNYENVKLQRLATISNVDLTKKAFDERAHDVYEAANSTSPHKESVIRITNDRYKKAQRDYLDAVDDYKQTKRKSQEVGTRYQRAMYKYKKTTLSRVSAKVVVAGMNFVSNLFSSKKKKKKKK